MPDPVDLYEYARLANIPEMLRQSGVNYPGLKQAPPPQALQDLLRSAPIGTAAASGGGLGFLGMLAALLAQGGDTDPNVAKFYAEKQRQQQLGQILQGQPKFGGIGTRTGQPLRNLEEELPYGRPPTSEIMWPPDIPPARRRQ